MRTIEITTSQNVTIKYELASASQRVFAFILDLIVLFIFVRIMAFVVGDNPYMIMFFIVPFILFYSLYSELLMNGATLGKKAVGIQVVKIDGTEPGFIDYFGRWATRIAEIFFSIGSVALIMVSTTPNGQRLGDILSGTTLIKTKTSSQFTLKNIVKLKNADDYKPKYPEVRFLTEEEMVLVKRIVDRHAQYDNVKNNLLVSRTANKIKERLGINPKVKAGPQFLKDLIKDYVILSR